jgi:hypothetical protein
MPGSDFKAVQRKRIRPARPDDILTEYFENQHATRPLNEVKLLLVGPVDQDQLGPKFLEERKGWAEISRTHQILDPHSSQMLEEQYGGQFGIDNQDFGRRQESFP